MDSVIRASSKCPQEPGGHTDESGLLNNRFEKLFKSQAGFTLIEMIVTVGIIALLAAVIIPNVGRFVGTGIQGAKVVELDHVEDAFELMMAETQATSVTPHDNSNSSSATSVWTTLPVGGADVLPLTGYLVSSSTVYFYCYDAAGVVSEQFETATPCALP